MLTHYGVKGLTTSFTPEQRKAVDEFLDPIIQNAIMSIKGKAADITAMDKRPHEIYSEKKPDVFFHYVGQAMLEDLIAYLQSYV